MTNPENLIRPPVLNVPNPPTVANQRSMDQYVTQLVDRLFSERIDGRNTFEEDELISGNNNLGELDKIPDIVRCLREFTGNPADYGSWKKSVERILNLYESIRGSAKYYGILSVIRNKIIGHADIVLESYNTPLNWTAISRCLNTHYGDKRDLRTLEYQMTSLTQGHLSIQDFYQKVYSHFSLILNKISCLEAGRESRNLLISTYRDKALDTFIRGLNGDLPRLLAMREPQDLPEALQLCIKLENQNFRSGFVHNNFNPRKNNIEQTALPIPPRRFNQQPNRQSFYPQLTNWAQPAHRNYTEYPIYRAPLPPKHFQQYPNNQPHFQRFNKQNQSAPPRPFGTKPLPKPEPMEVDQSMQTRHINYMNRPAQTQQFQGKRPAPHPNADKRQRNFNIEIKEYEDTMEAAVNPEFDQPLSEYTGPYQTEYYEGNQNQNTHIDTAEEIDFTDVHFLE